MTARVGTSHEPRTAEIRELAARDNDGIHAAALAPQRNAVTVSVEDDRGDRFTSRSRRITPSTPSTTRSPTPPKEEP